MWNHVIVHVQRISHDLEDGHLAMVHVEMLAAVDKFAPRIDIHAVERRRIFVETSLLKHINRCILQICKFLQGPGLHFTKVQATRTSTLGSWRVGFRNKIPRMP